MRLGGGLGQSRRTAVRCKELLCLVFVRHLTFPSDVDPIATLFWFRWFWEKKMMTKRRAGTRASRETRLSSAPGHDGHDTHDALSSRRSRKSTYPCWRQGRAPRGQLLLREFGICRETGGRVRERDGRSGDGDGYEHGGHFRRGVARYGDSHRRDAKGTYF